MRLPALMIAITMGSGAVLADPLSRYGDWREQFSEEFRLGYVSALAQEQMDVERKGDAASARLRKANAQCLGNLSPQALLAAVDKYAGNNLATYSYSPDVVVLMAIHEMCKGYLSSR